MPERAFCYFTMTGKHLVVSGPWISDGSPDTSSTFQFWVRPNGPILPRTCNIVGTSCQTTDEQTLTKQHIVIYINATAKVIQNERNFIRSRTANFVAENHIRRNRFGVYRPRWNHEGIQRYNTRWGVADMRMHAYNEQQKYVGL